MKKYDISEQLEIIKKVILDTVQAKYIYLFGSYAYGKPTEKSDIDIYIVVPDTFDKKITLTMGKIANYLYNYQIFTADLFIIKEKKFIEYKKYHSFEKTISEKGILIYGY
ncbi:MAG: nucleotidyltransferase domain-containing protein [Treponema sp.]|nr:nucleotidyltransferase domain-containing protein [Treponema sp.]